MNTEHTFDTKHIFEKETAIWMEMVADSSIGQYFDIRNILYMHSAASPVRCTLTLTFSHALMHRPFLAKRCLLSVVEIVARLRAVVLVALFDLVLELGDFGRTRVQRRHGGDLGVGLNVAVLARIRL